MRKIIALPAGEPKHKIIKYIGWVMAGYLVLLIIDQFIRATRLSNSIFDFAENGQIGWIVFAALFAIPFLVDMKASVGMRFLSLLFGWTLSALFLSIAIADKGEGCLMNRWALILFCLLMIKMTWGRWPLPLSRTDKKPASKTTKRTPSKKRK